MVECNNKKIYFITGGGTGGHIYPAVAVADELLKNVDTGKIYYVGNPNNLEASIVKDKNYTFLPVISSGMPRKLSFSFIAWSFKMLFALIKCIIYINKYKPDVIFGTGGYVSAPVLMAGILTKTPFVMHDCDANPGLVTRKLSPYAKSISIAFEAARDKLNNKNIYLNGNPIRVDFSTLTKEQAKKDLQIDDNRLTVCVMGGSQGARTINDATVNIIAKLSKDLGLHVIFQTGKKNYDEVIKKLKEIYPDYENDKNITVRPYFDNMVTVLKASDIAVSRAGSLSISELCASGVATIYIPYPYAAANHQRKNAKSMVEKGTGLYLEDSDVNADSLFNMISGLCKDSEKLNLMQKTVLSFAKYDGVQKIVEQIIDSIN